MGQVGEAGGFGGEKVLTGGGGVSEASGDSGLGHGVDEIDAAWHFGGDGNDVDWGDFLEGKNFCGVGWSDEGWILGADESGVEEWALDVQAGSLGAVHVVSVGGHGARGGHQVGQG